MTQQLDKNTLGYLGIDFQYKLAKLFAEDHGLFNELHGIINPNAFTDQLLRTFIGTIVDYYDENGLIPSYDTINVLLNSRSRTETDIEEYTALIKKLKTEVSLEGYETNKKLAVKFFKQQNLIKVAHNLLDIASKGDLNRYEECQRMLDEVAMVGQDDDLGFSPFDKIDEALSPNYTVHVPTGIDLLDGELGGGLAKKKVGVIIGSAGFGKTTMSTAIASFASTYKCEANNYEGFKVLQIYFEDDDVDMVRKHISKKTLIESRLLTENQEAIEQIRSVLENLPDKETLRKNLRLKSFKAHEKSATDIGLFVKKLMNFGWKPDMVLIDYFECMAPEKGGYKTDSKWDREGVTMRTLENIAKELDIAIWVPTQGNKDSMKTDDIVTMDQAGGSVVKVQAASVILSICRSVEMQENNKATLALIKNRGGRNRVWRDIVYDNGTCTISCESAIEYDSTKAYQDDTDKIKEENEIKLKRRLVELRSKDRETVKPEPIQEPVKIPEYVAPVVKQDEDDLPF